MLMINPCFGNAFTTVVKLIIVMIIRMLKILIKVKRTLITRKNILI